MNINIRMFINQKTLRNSWYRRIRLKLRRWIFDRNVIVKPYRDSMSIFVHVPKSAGKSISSSLYGTDKPGHYYLTDYYLEDEVFCNAAYKFAFIRDPLERLKSAYYFLLEGGGSTGDNTIGEYLKLHTSSFEDFVLNWLNEDRLYSWPHFVPQSEFMCVNGEVAVDFLGRFENIGEDFDTVCLQLGKENNLKEINKTKAEKLGGESLDVKRKVKRLYAQDYFIYGY
jgi:hypothetical protein